VSAPRRLILTEEGRKKLIEMRDYHAKPYLRERAAALLKIAEGMPLSRVAQEGLLKPRAPATVREWVKRYEAGGLAGLLIRPGRGRKPAFFPSAKHG
jgi:transposase